MLQHFKLSIFSIFILCLVMFSPYAEAQMGAPPSAEEIQVLEDEAAKGDPAKQLVLGTLYLSGNGVEKDLDKAEDLLTKSAEQGHDHGQFILGLFYSTLMFGATPDKEKAAFWLKKSAAQGNKKAAQALAGLKAAPEKIEKLETLSKKAEAGDANAQYLLAGRYRNGTGGAKKDAAEGRKWLEKAAKQGDPLAQSDWGLMLLRSDKTKEGIDFMTKAAEKGVVHSQLELASLYLQGKVVEKDVEKGVFWLVVAAEHGDKRAISILQQMQKKQ